MAMQDIRKFAHELLKELGDDAILGVIRNIRAINDKRNQMSPRDAFIAESPSEDDLRAIQKANKEFQNGELLTHEAIFGKEVYV